MLTSLVEAVLSRSKPPDPGPPPLPWYEGAAPSEYIAWVYRELVIQGIDVLELADRFRVLKDLIAWRDTFPNDAFARSVCWNSYDLETLVERSRDTRRIAKPRIEVSAQITTKQNLSVRWHPAGFHEAEDDANRPMRSYNVLDPNAFREPPDFDSSGVTSHHHSRAGRLTS
ncbi:MAG: hypothetical protein ABWZ27_09475 [Aestuariivirgaceae bacterium]